jgi:hypothetical protein
LFTFNIHRTWYIFIYYIIFNNNNIIRIISLACYPRSVPFVIEN